MPTRSRFVFTFLALVFFLGLNQSVSAIQKSDGSVVETLAYAFPGYEQAAQTTNVKANTSKEEYLAAINDGNFEFSKLKYLSDGFKVTAYVYKPARLNDKKLPAIIFNRGGLVRNDIAPELIVLFHTLAKQGFVVVAPLYRQSDGSEGRDEMGGGDVNDLMNVVPLAKSLGFIDVNNLFLFGESRGGVMVYLVLKRNFPARAAAVYGALTDLEALLKERPDIYTPKLLNQLWTEFDKRKDEIIKSRSAIYWPETLNVPLLIMQGGADKSVSPAQSLAIAQKLQNLGKTYELIIYAGDDHTLSHNRDDRDRTAISWFKKYLATF